MSRPRMSRPRMSRPRRSRPRRSWSRRCRLTACAASTDRPDLAFDLDADWQLHPRVSIRPERFGALLYHFGTRRLSFLKRPALLTVVRELGDAPSAREACRRAGLTEAELPAYAAA